MRNEQQFDFKEGIDLSDSSKQRYQKFIELCQKQGRMAAIGLAPVPLKLIKTSKYKKVS